MFTEAPLLRTACDRCHKRKQRCTRSSFGIEVNPCRRCREAGEECVFSPPCRLGRPTNKSKQERQEKGEDLSEQKIKVTSNSHTTHAPSQLNLLRSQSLEHCKRKNRSQFSGSRHHKRQPGKPGRPRRSQPSPSTPTVNSPFSTASAPDILDDTISSTASVTSSAPSLSVFTDHLKDSTTSLHQVQSALIQHRVQQTHYTYPTSVPQDYYLPVSGLHSISTQTANLSSSSSLWNATQGVPYRVQDGYPVRNMLLHNNNSPTPMPPVHSGTQSQTHSSISPRQNFHSIDLTTFPSNDKSMSMSHNQQFGRGNLPQPLTPPPFSPAAHVECIDDHTVVPMYPGFMYSRVEAYHAGNTCLNEAAEQYHAVYGKHMENPMITPATFEQNYHLQLQSSPTGSVNAIPGNWPRTPTYFW